jgi:hypothetical protein
VNGRFDALEVRLDRLETEYQMIGRGAAPHRGDARRASH